MRLHGSEQKMHDFVFAVQTRDFEYCATGRNQGAGDHHDYLEYMIQDEPVLGELQ